MKKLLLGDEAIAQGALDAGISGVYAYPGTPSTEITEYIQASAAAKRDGVHSKWCANEKTALEEAMGMAYAGKRAMACMKHVGLNVAADGFMNAAMTGIHGGLVIVVADDPSMHSSQNEQDTRVYAKFAGVPLLEPSNQQQAYTMVREAFDLSEETGLPVLLRITTRLAHSRADVQQAPARGPNERSFPADTKRYILIPMNARRQNEVLVSKQVELEERSATSGWNEFPAPRQAPLGVIACGLALNYVREIIGDDPSIPVLVIRQYPLPAERLRAFCAGLESVLVVEDGAPFVEEQLRGILPTRLNVRGRLDGALPRTGEMSPDAVARAFGHPVAEGGAVPEVVRPRPPQLCKGCPHVESFAFLKATLDQLADEVRVFSDIGCYALGALPPYDAIHTCVDMGASVTMAKGAADAGVHPAIAVIGDSTFTHSGITGLLDAVYENTRMVILILDNETVGMTGRQESLATGRLDRIVAGIGVDPRHLRVVTPLKKNREENQAILREEIDYDGISVVISRRPCIHVKRNL